MKKKKEKEKEKKEVRKKIADFFSETKTCP